MGRLTLNVLLSFAQFEREVTGERIRDKIAASKKKGIWVGGVVPLGYELIDRKLIVNEEEAKTVRLIYERYLALGSLPALQRDLRSRGIVTRKRLLSTGQTIGGVPLTNGPLVYLLRNRMYRGELNHRDKSYPGEHQPIIEEDLFNQVQAKLSGNRRGSQLQRQPSEALLLGKLFDDRGNKMTPSYAIKKGFAIPIMSPASWRRAARKRQAQSPASAPMRSRTSSSASWHRFYHRWKGASDKSNPRQQPSLTRSPTGSASRHLSTGSSSVPSQSRSGWRRIGISPVDPNPSPSPGRPRPSGASAR
jgi:hypothetical protein